MRNVFPVSNWLLVPFAISAFAAGAQAAPWQCESRWEGGFSQVEVAPGVTAMAVGNVGAGSRLFFNYGTDPLVAPISHWDGTSVVQVGVLRPNGFAGEAAVRDMITFDSGAGTELFIAGAFQDSGGVHSANVIRWNGTSFLPAPIGDAWDHGAFGLCIHDDGSGPAVYACGDFASAPSVSRWNGSTFVPVGSGGPGFMRAIASYDDGTGAKLYAANWNSLARWDGSTWTTVASVQGINDMVVADQGAGPRLFVGGSFTQIGVSPYAHVAAFDGTSWISLGGGINGDVDTLRPFFELGVLKIGAGGAFSMADGAPVPNMAKWDGNAWHAVGGGTNGPVGALALYDSGAGVELVAGGSFTVAGNVATSSMARWTSTRWSRLSEGEGANSEVRALCEHDDGAGRALFAGGAFTRVGGQLASRVARWNGAAWTTLGTGLAGNSYPLPFIQPGAWALASFDDGNGLGLFVGGDFETAGGVAARGIAVWRNGAWSAVGSGISGSGKIQALCVHDDGSGPAIYAGGRFTSIGGVTTTGIARWDGTSWSAVGGGITTQDSYDGVYALASWDDGLGGGPVLYAGGSFDNTGGVAGTPNLGAWNGTSWVPMGGPFYGGANNFVYALHPFDDGAGSKLHVGGAFSILGGFYCKGIGSWNGSHFWPVGVGFPNVDVGNTGVWPVRALGVFDEGVGRGARLYATGYIESSNGTDFNGIARWSGAAWETLGSGFTQNTGGLALASFDDGSSAGPALFAGGGFSTAGGLGSSNLARWRSLCPDPREFCFGDGSGTACPCGNAGASGNGCATSFNPSGAHLGASGTPSVANDTVVLSGSGLSPSIVTFFQGTQRQSGGAGAVFGDGLRCAGGSTIRLGAESTVGGSAQYPGPGDASVSARGLVPATGGTRTYQLWYRNAASFCTPSTFNLSNGVEITFAP